jgi:hypothetical protein
MCDTVIHRHTPSYTPSIAQVAKIRNVAILRHSTDRRMAARDSSLHQDEPAARAVKSVRTRGRPRRGGQRRTSGEPIRK